MVQLALNPNEAQNKVEDEIEAKRWKDRRYLGADLKPYDGSMGRRYIYLHENHKINPM